jgi:hypothetical protein
LGVTRDPVRTGSFAAVSKLGGPTTFSQKVPVHPFERYRLTAWGRYTKQPPDTAVPIEATVEFFDGEKKIDVPSTRCLLRTLDPADGWSRLRLTVSVPARADSAVISLRRSFNGVTLWDDVVLERIRQGLRIPHGRLADSFDGSRLDLTRWTRMPPHGGVHPPPTRSGSLEMDADDVYPLTSLAQFNDLIEHKGPGRYRLRLHTTAASPVKGRPSTASFSLTNSGTPVSRMLWYLYFSGPGRTQPMLSSFNDQAGVRTFASSWAIKHLANRGDDIWCTFYFDPTEVTVFASADAYDESEKSLVCRYKHGLTNMTTNGSIYLGLFRGPYRVDDIQLVRPRPHTR